MQKLSRFDDSDDCRARIYSEHASTFHLDFNACFNFDLIDHIFEITIATLAIFQTKFEAI